MGHKNGRLVKFITDGLQREYYCNLKWHDEDSQIFCLKLPRYNENKDLRHYEMILMKWCTINNRKYTGYSGAKSVIKAAMKKSPFLVELRRFRSQYYFRFATKAEELEKRRLQKLKSKQQHKPFDESSNLLPVLEDGEMSLSDESNLLNISFSPIPPSTPSSGYQSGNEDTDKSIEECKTLDDLAALDDLFNDPASYINALNDGLDNEALLFNNTMVESKDAVPESNVNSNNIQYSQKFQPMEVQYSQKFQPMEVQYSQKFKPVEELVATEVHTSTILNTYWLCTKKVRFGSILQLICEKQVIKEENLGFVPGQIYLNNVFEPGETYNLKKMFELDGKCFLFLSQNN